ncbi:MAG: uncharacterized protein KVP18_001920 [Porospora cf. gigantea A]|uniref:uncharacterized protein n=1 Tax=Porospora cf. gigantea A TaxID=2853593 RepID=UPI00355A296C|nr:MAG: hypothetical protein KVP18_001920 [Porospora cf. gigantea A]
MPKRDGPLHPCRDTKRPKLDSAPKCDLRKRPLEAPLPPSKRLKSETPPELDDVPVCRAIVPFSQPIVTHELRSRARDCLRRLPFYLNPSNPEDMIRKS